MRWIVAFLMGAALAGCAAEREAVDPLLLEAQQADERDRVRAETDRLMNALLEQAKRESDAHEEGDLTEPPVVDVLVISGGGDWGAFGTGVLKGWGSVTAPEWRRPSFDVVTGVSTGALIAPFAFLGDEASIERVVQIYRNPQRDWAQRRGRLFFLPHHASFATTPGLEHEIAQAMDAEMIRRIAASDPGRMLEVNTTNVDLGTPRPWDLVLEARRALLTEDPGHLHRILLASAAIPGAFPPRMIDGHLYVDGSITGNILYGGRMETAKSFSARWARRYPQTPIPRQRYWVIFNNQVRFPPQVIQPVWPEVVGRSQAMATQAATVNATRHLHAMAQVARLEHGAEVEVRWIAIPEGWAPPTVGPFQRETMDALTDLGERMGALPTS